MRLMNTAKLMIDLHFEFTGSRKGARIGVANCANCLGKKRYRCLPHLDKVLPN